MSRKSFFLAVIEPRMGGGYLLKEQKVLVYFRIGFGFFDFGIQNLK
jgi:hypothetical protein